MFTLVHNLGTGLAPTLTAFATSDYLVKAYADDGSLSCDLSDVNTYICEIPFKLEVVTKNGTLTRDFADTEARFSSECHLLSEPA